MAKIKLPNGREYDFAALPFSEEAIELISMNEQSDVSMGAFLKVFRACIRQSLEASGYKPDEIDAALKSIPLSDKGQPVLAKIMAVLLDGNVGAEQ